MAGIELDLLSTEVDRLDEKYAGESPEQRRARFERYEAAFAEYDRRYAAYMEELNVYAHGCRTRALRGDESQAEDKDRADERSIEAQIALA